MLFESVFRPLADPFQALSPYVHFCTDAATVLGLLLACCEARRVRRDFVRQRTYDRLHTLYSLATDLFRRGLTIQRAKKGGKQYDLQPLIDSREHLKNWYHDNKFLFDATIGQLVDEVDEEARQIAHTGCMDKLKELKSELLNRMKKLM